MAELIWSFNTPGLGRLLQDFLQLSFVLFLGNWDECVPYVLCQGRNVEAHIPRVMTGQDTYLLLLLPSSFWNFYKEQRALFIKQRIIFTLAKWDHQWNECQLTSLLWNSNIRPDVYVKYPNNWNILISLLSSLLISKIQFFFCYKQKYMRKFVSKMFSNTIRKFPDYKMKVHSYLWPREVRHGREEVRAAMGGTLCRRHVWGPCRPSVSAGSLSQGSAPSSGQGKGGRGTLACRLAPAARGCKGRS